MFTARSKRLQRVFRGSHSEMLETAIKKDLNIPSTEIQHWEDSEHNNHQFVCPNWTVTRFIDYKAYSGSDVRKEIYNTLEGDVLDICCGTGFSTKPGNTGIDTSLEMLRFTRIFNPGSNYLYGNAEKYGKNKEFDTISCMFSFHEMPTTAHEKILRNCIRVAKKEIVIVDISTDYKPSKAMLTGEPYITDYFENVGKTLYDHGFKKYVLIEKHVDIWKLNL